MNKHTPSPWLVENVTAGEKKKTLIYLRVSHEGTAIAGVAASGSKRKKNEVASVYARHVDERAEADALLIAAAPDLLDALESTLHSDLNGPVTCLGAEVRELIEKAIAKARGGK